jgi:4-hydroxybenzoate polyprenyltransferase
MSAFFKIIRFPNVLMTLLTQVVIVYGLLLPAGIVTALAWWQLVLLLLATAFLTASGNVINDIYDVEIDRVNKPEKLLVTKSISEKNAFNMYIILTVLAVVCGFILANSIQKPIFAIIFIAAAFVLYLYASSLKGILLIGNLVISIMVGLVIIITGIFELLPSINPENKEAYKVVFTLLIKFGLLAFLINLVKEWVKGCENVNGDKAGGRSTLAIALGRSRAAKVIAVFIFGILILLGWYVYEYLYLNDLVVYYIVFAIMGPLMYVMIQLWTAQTKKQFHLLSTILKIILLLGILSIGILNINL